MITLTDIIPFTLHVSHTLEGIDINVLLPS